MTTRATSDVPDERSWRQEAACRDQPAIWFTDPAGPTDTTRAMATCARCPVRRACLTTALSYPVDSDIGVWGGTTEQTRRRLRTGALDLDQTLDLPPGRRAPTPDPLPPAPTSAARPTIRQATRRAVPELTVGRTASGTYESADGRTVIFRIHGDPPWMLMVDDRPIVRTDTLADARRRAWAVHHSTDAQAVHLDMARGR